MVKIRAKVFATSYLREPDCHHESESAGMREIGSSVSVSDGAVYSAISESGFDKNFTAVGEVV